MPLCSANVNWPDVLQSHRLCPKSQEISQALCSMMSARLISTDRMDAKSDSACTAQYWNHRSARLKKLVLQLNRNYQEAIAAVVVKCNTTIKKGHLNLVLWEKGCAFGNVPEIYCGKSSTNAGRFQLPWKSSTGCCCASSTWHLTSISKVAPSCQGQVTVSHTGHVHCAKAGIHTTNIDIRGKKIDYSKWKPFQLHWTENFWQTGKQKLPGLIEERKGVIELVMHLQTRIRNFIISRWEGRQQFINFWCKQEVKNPHHLQKYSKKEATEQPQISLSLR